MVYHIISRTFQGAMLLTPSGALNEIVAGVIARAQELYQEVQLYTHAFLSNHFHMMLKGPPEQIPAFIGFVKGEISRRWGREIGWQDGLWGAPYSSTALPTAEDQLRCYEYILSQGVKEGLVEKPEEWPGLHAAKQLFMGKPTVGKWLDGTAYAKAKVKDQARRKPRGVSRAKFTTDKTVRLDVLPVWAHMSSDEIAEQNKLMRDRIIAAGKEARGGKHPLGVKAIKKTRRTQRRPLPKLPWWEDRKRMICWSSPNSPEAAAYINRYWDFQNSFRKAAKQFALGQPAVFPRGCFAPGRFTQLANSTDARITA